MESSTAMFVFVDSLQKQVLIGQLVFSSRVRFGRCLRLTATTFVGTSTRETMGASVTRAHLQSMLHKCSYMLEIRHQRNKFVCYAKIVPNAFRCARRSVVRDFRSFQLWILTQKGWADGYKSGEHPTATYLCLTKAWLLVIESDRVQNKKFCQGGWHHFFESVIFQVRWKKSCQEGWHHFFFEDENFIPHTRLTHLLLAAFCFVCFLSLVPTC